MAIKDSFPSRGPLDPAYDAFTITPDDDNDLAQKPRALWIGGDGDLALAMPSGNVTLVGVIGGQFLPIRPIRVLEATTATEIVGLV